MATTLDLAIVQGATFRRHLLWRQPQTAAQVTAGEKGTPYDLTDAVAHMQIRQKVNGAVLLDLVDGDGLVLGDTDGTIVIEIDSEKSMTLEMKRPGVYDLFVVFPSGEALRVVAGSVTVSLAVTDPVG